MGETVLSSSSDLGTLVENQFAIDDYFWTLSSILLIFMSVIMPGPRCLEDDFEIGKCEFYNFVLFSRLFWLMLDPLCFHMNFRIGLCILAKKATDTSL